MPPTPKWPKSFVATYIHKQYKQQSRYEIDTILLQGGHSPEEIEAAWQLLNPAPARPTPISFLWLDFLLLFGSLLLGAFSLFSPGFWPFAGVISAIYPIIALISLGAFIFILFWGKARKRAGYKESIIPFVTNCFLGLIFAGALLVSLIINNAISYREITTLSAQGHDYHLLQSEGCLEACTNQIILYRCSFFNLICPEIDSVGLGYPGDDTPSPIISNFKNINLKIEQNTGKVLLLEDDKVVYTFKNPS